MSNALFANNFQQDTFPPSTIKLTIKNLLPRPEIKLSSRHGYDHLTAHDCTLQMSITVILTRSVMFIKTQRLVGCELLQPALKIMMKASFIVINKYRSRNVHGVTENKALLNATLGQAGGYLWGNINKASAGLYLKPELFAI